MEAAIFDTTVWIDFINGVDDNRTILLENYIKNASSNLYLTPTILQEILQGLRTEQDFLKTMNILKSFNILDADWQDRSVEASKLYFELRKKGITIRKSTDCLVAAVAIWYDFLLVHNDTDFDKITPYCSLRTHR